MNTNFFNQLEQLELTGVLHITISKGVANTLVVSTLLTNEACGDKAKHLITPLNLKGTAAELDEGYFQNIAKPMQTASGLMTNMEAYMKQLDEAKKQSAIEKDKSEKDKKAKAEKDKKYNEAMQKVSELEKAGKYREAFSKIPDPAQFPEHAESINKRKSALSAKFTPNIFEAFGAPEPETESDPEEEENESEEYPGYDGDEDEDTEEE